MFTALYLPPLSSQVADARARLMTVAQEFSPRVERISDHLLSLDVGGLGRWFEGADRADQRGAYPGRAVGEALRRTAADRGLAAHVAVASTRTAALLLARGRAGLTVVLAGEEPARLAPLPLNLLSSWTAPGVERSRSRKAVDGLPLATLHRWGLKTLGDLAALPAVDLSERLGQEGVVWQRLARGEDLQPLVPVLPDERFEESLALEWPIDQLEPLSFVLGRLFDSLCTRLEQADRGVAVLHVRLDLVGRERFARVLQLPAPMRDARTLRTLALLDLESNPPPAAIDRVTVAAEVVEGRVLQFSLLARALPAERLSTLLARLSALMGADRVGAPALVDSYRPGVFAMTPFEANRTFHAEAAEITKIAEKSSPKTSALSASSAAAALKNLITNHRPLTTAVVRRFRRPIPARVDVHQGRPVRVASDRRHLRGGSVVVCAGPWRSSGEWWATEKGSGVFSGSDAAKRLPTPFPWDRDEWDVTLRDGASYVIFRDRPRGNWFIDGILD
jgi:protein ImuB